MEHALPASQKGNRSLRMFEVHENVERHKQDFNEKEESSRQRELELRKKDLSLQESLVPLKKFLQDNDAKCARALRRATDERHAREVKEKEILQLGISMQELQAQQARMIVLVQKCIRYKQYLVDTLDASDEHHDVDELMHRHATLTAINAGLKDKYAAGVALLDDTRLELHHTHKYAADKTLHLKNAITRLKMHLESCQQEAAQLDMGRESAQQLTADKTLEYGMLCMATENLLSRCRTQSKVGHAVATNPLMQLEVVGSFIVDLAGIIKEEKLRSAAVPKS